MAQKAKSLPAMWETWFNLWVGRAPGEGNGNPLQYSCLENPMDAGDLQVTVHRVAKRWTWLRDFTFTFHFQYDCTFVFIRESLQRENQQMQQMFLILPDILIFIWPNYNYNNRDVASRAILHAERPRFHGPLLIKTRLLTPLRRQACGWRHNT